VSSCEGDAKEDRAVAHAKDRGEKHQKKAAQKSIKEKRASKKAKKESARPQHLTTTGE
jgi:hypothetical protein